MIFRAFILTLAFLIIPTVMAAAQGCGPINPNCIVPTAPVGTNNNQAASTAFVQQNSGSGLLLNMGQQTVICNPLLIAGPAQVCPDTIADYPLTTAITPGHISFSGTFTNDRTYFGFNSGINAGGVGNTTFGANTLGALTTGSQNAAFGASALHADTSGSTNAAVGFNSMAANTIGGSNTAVGAGSNPISTSNNNNTCMGSNCFLVLSGGNTNTAFGNGAGSSITSGSDNIIGGGIVGTGTHGVTTGSKNIMLGKYDNATNSGITTGDQNTVIGPATGLTNPSNAIVIADGAGNQRWTWNNSTSTWTSPGTINTTNVVATAAAPTVAAAQVGYGSTITTAGSGTCPATMNTSISATQAVAGCLIINVAGTPRNAPFF